ncbi:sensor histidine kinase [Clostridium luticellarii]|jgi:LytS/YehU family sensor histidine kinase|uniref:sensor histidine kinase n=1 Tax=Clostridium luticellarii TaxID=1691940 RepID=UPI0023569960|nr:PocR ligand-binding domain-containing protein [Clostridium luticellarii]MCI1945129.1 PocR ligand-binding domain-containing protein [Clostridium luticellarii]MCI1968518.1 PocR ligand-binding domain-containing protein [Clostridium luticellarii]MCI1995971.1 PocR ligand-binding domain-containing protein [Clostridium luticellarii]MCI2040470.1 PocR ligand-binding domain-containing protein [Clostridium luticellarii]
MDLLKNIKFEDIIDVKALQDIQDRLTKLVKFPTIIVDINGMPVCKESNFTPFCSLMRSSPKGRKNCILCDSQASFLAMRDKNPRIYTCHTGLMDSTAPIIVNNYYLGGVLGGQVLIKGKHNKDSINLGKISKEYEIPIEKLKKVTESLQFVEIDYLHNCVEFYNFLASYIAEMGIHRITQENLLKESEEKSILENQAKKMQLKTIQAQINPHFLFNTLNTIARMALIENAPKTEDLLYTLSDLLRYSLRNSEEFPKLSSEIDYTKRYLLIQNMRFSDRMTYRIEVDEAILDCRIPAMTIQPIVENSLSHGLNSQTEEGEIIIKGGLTPEKDILIEISDNGVGIDKNLLALLNNSDIMSEKLGIGIRNTNNRLKHYFGSKYGLKIKSKLNVGTKVEIRIPRIKA